MITYSWLFFRRRLALDNTAIVSVQEQKQLQLLNNGLITADRFINKNYLINISEQNIVPLDDYEKLLIRFDYFKSSNWFMIKQKI